jgi:nucleotide-binding universal stress UspA family protein
MSPVSVRRLLVGVDGSDDAQRALGWAIGIAIAFEAEVVAVHAVGLVMHINGGLTVPTEPHLDEIRTTFETDWCQLLDDSSVANRREAIHGDPVDVLSVASRRFNADVLVVGRRGLGRVQTLRLGSTSQALTERSTIPVLVIPRPSDPASAG